MSAYLAALKVKLQAALEPPSEEVPEAERGTEIVQMALVLALVVVVAATVLQGLGVDIVAKLVEVANALH